jgi:hypothetical protein
MRIRNVVILSLVLAAPAWGQQPPARPQPSQPGRAPDKAKPAADSLEGVIADAMKNNPDIRAAEAKVREAQNNLNKVRSEVMVAVAAAREIVQNAKEMHRAQEQLHAAKKELFRKGQLSSLEMLTSEIELQRSKATLVSAEAELHKLIGRVPGMPGVGQADSVWSNRMVTTEWANQNYSLNPINLGWTTDRQYLDFVVGKGTFNPIPMTNAPFTTPGAPATPAASLNMIEKIRAALDKPIKVEKEVSNGTVKAVSTYLRDQVAKDLQFRFLLDQNASNSSVTLEPGELPFGAWLISVQDEVPNLVFVVREYGILVTTRERAPKDAIPVAEFWRSSKAAKPKEEKKDEDKPREEKK